MRVSPAGFTSDVELQSTVKGCMQANTERQKAWSDVRRCLESRMPLFVAGVFCSIHFPLRPSLTCLNSRRSPSTLATDPGLAPSRSATQRGPRLKMSSSDAPSELEPSVARLPGFPEPRRGDGGAPWCARLVAPSEPVACEVLSRGKRTRGSSQKNCWRWGGW